MSRQKSDDVGKSDLTCDTSEDEQQTMLRYRCRGSVNGLAEEHQAGEKGGSVVEVASERLFRGPGRPRGRGDGSMPGLAAWQGSILLCGPMRIPLHGTMEPIPRFGLNSRWLSSRSGIEPPRVGALGPDSYRPRHARFQPGLRVFSHWPQHAGNGHTVASCQRRGSTTPGMDAPTCPRQDRGDDGNTGSSHFVNTPGPATPTTYECAAYSTGNMTSVRGSTVQRVTAMVVEVAPKTSRPEAGVQ